MKMFKRVLCFGLAMLLYVPMVNRGSAVVPENLRQNVRGKVKEIMQLEDTYHLECEELELLKDAIDLLLDHIDKKQPRELERIAKLHSDQQVEELNTLIKNQLKSGPLVVANDFLKELEKKEKLKSLDKLIVKIREQKKQESKKRHTEQLKRNRVLLIFVLGFMVVLAGYLNYINC